MNKIKEDVQVLLDNKVKEIIATVETLRDLKKSYPNLKIAQWFLDPLNKRGPDFLKNKSEFLSE